MANPMDPVHSHDTFQERQPAATPELPDGQPHQPLKQGHTEDHTEQIEATVEKIIADQKAGFRAGRSTIELIFNLRIVCEKYLQYRQDLNHVFIDMDRPGVRQVPEDSGEQRKLEKTGCEVICGAPTTPMVMG